MIITRTPLRIGIVGGGSDIPTFCTDNVGACINAAIDKYVYVLVKRRYDNFIYLKYSENEIVSVEEIDSIKHDFIREALKYVGIDFGLEIINYADIPTKGTGLGSSSSFLVGLLNALYTLIGVHKNQQELASIACYIEIVLCNKEIGYQDQFIAAYGNIRYMQFHAQPEQTYVLNLKYTGAQLERLSRNFVMYYTGETRSASQILSKQSSNISKTGSKLELMKKNVDLADRLLIQLQHHNYFEIGNYLDANWNLKKQFSEDITNEKINNMYTIAKANGAAGAKITGAGGGGFLLVYANQAYHLQISHAMKESFDAKEMPISIDQYGTRVLLNIEEHVW